jgi:hypothetical protein
MLHKSGSRLSQPQHGSGRAVRWPKYLHLDVCSFTEWYHTLPTFSTRRMYQLHTNKKIARVLALEVCCITEWYNVFPM